MALSRYAPMIQNIHSNGATLVWYTDVADDSKVQVGTSSGNYTYTFQNTTSVPLNGAGDTKYKHEVKVRGLQPNTKYFYTVGNNGATLQSGVNNYFWTSPLRNTSQSVRIWAMADMGIRTNGNQSGVINGFSAFNGTDKVDLILQIGDLVYDNGTWPEFDYRWFNYPSPPSTSNNISGYANQYLNIPIYAVLGNHDYGQLTQANINNQPYSKIFSHPTLNDSGGVASRDIRWYSFDYGDIHIISLDGWYYRNGGDAKALEPNSPQYNWLINDLENFVAERAAGKKTWCILMEHFPSFSKGSHNSDTSIWNVAMRTYIAPLVYQYNIDLVLHGHSHIYERSYFINGFNGLSLSFTGGTVGSPTYPYIAQSGRGDNSQGNPPYNKTAGVPNNVGAVFMTIGNGGQPSTTLSTTSSGYPHLANITNLINPWNSIIIDITNSGNSHTMHVKTLAHGTGVIEDEFIILR